MTLSAQLGALATRVATEFKALRTAFGTTAAVQFGKLTVGSSTPSGRIPFKSSHVLNASDSGAGNHVAHLFQSIMSGNWSSDTPPDPGFTWGTNFFTTTGTNSGDGNGIVSLYGGLIEAS